MGASTVLISDHYSHLKGKPHWKRTLAVYTALDQAPVGYSYSQLMEWVGQQTGQKCSRKLIKKWKDERQSLFVNEDKATEQGMSSSPWQPVPLSPDSSASLGQTQPSSTEQSPDVPFPQPPRSQCSPVTVSFPLLQGLKQLGQVVSLTAIFLGANFMFTPQDSTVKLAVAEAPMNGNWASKIGNHEGLSSPLPTHDSSPNSVEPNRLKIELTITDPSDLKIKPGDKVVKGQVISDRTTERRRLLNQRKQLELSLKKLTLTIPPLQSPNSIAQLPNLPPISYQQEQANIALKAQQLKEAAQAVSHQQQKIDSIRQLSPRPLTQSPITSHQPSVDSSFGAIVQPPTIPHNQPSVIHQQIEGATEQTNPQPANKTLNPNQKFIINLPTKNSDSPITIKPIPETVTPNPSNAKSKLKAILDHETAILNQLKGKEEKAKYDLQIAKSQLETAKEQRRYAEHQLYLENNRREIALQQQHLELERQRTIRAGQLQEQEYSKTQIEAKILEIDNAINQLSTVKVPYNGTIKKVKWTGQSDHTLTVTVTLDVDDSSVSQLSSD